MTVSFGVMSASLSSNESQARLGTRPHRSPTRDDKGEIICEHNDCEGNRPRFKRLCEYNKHMDKHERPYKCNNAACRKSQGFTYAGGLLRHQREVHNMHRTKDPFFCPHSSCNRSAGTGFSRRENLEEHMRRRHSGPHTDHSVSPVTTSMTAAVSSPSGKTDSTTATSHLKYLEPVSTDRKRRADNEVGDVQSYRHRRGLDQYQDFQLGAEERELYRHDHQALQAQIMVLRQDNDRIRTELYRRDQMLNEMSQENKRLRDMLAISLPTMPSPAAYPRSPPHPPPFRAPTAKTISMTTPAVSAPSASQYPLHS